MTTKTTESIIGLAFHELHVKTMNSCKNGPGSLIQSDITIVCIIYIYKYVICDLRDVHLTSLVFHILFQHVQEFIGQRWRLSGVDGMLDLRSLLVSDLCA